MEKKRIAIVGSGVSGLGALYSLRNTNHEIHLYEAADRLGGHTNTLPFEYEGRKIMVDTGFIVMNTATYPNFIPFLKELGIEPIATAMTFGISRDSGSFEWSGTNLNSIFAQRSNIFRPQFWRMIFDIIRFNQFSLDLLSDTDGTLENEVEMSIGEYLEREGYSATFRDDYLIPMTACVWSTAADKCALEFPAVTLVRFMWNHHLLSTVAKRPDWLTIPGGSKRYIDALMEKFPQRNVHLNSPVEAVRNDVEAVRNDMEERVVVQFASGRKETFDEVILACHGDQAREIVSPSAMEEEMKIMRAFETTPNMVYLHSDTSLLPQRPIAWSAWNYLTTTSPNQPHPSTSPSGSLQKVSLTYNMNILQHIPTSTYSHVLVTMNPPHPPSPSLTQATISYRHPLYNAAAVRSQNLLKGIQGKRGIWYAGAWTGYGFHEDGFWSGVKVGMELGGGVPWRGVDAKFMRGRRPVRGWGDWAARVLIVVVQFWVRLLDLVVGVMFGELDRGKLKKV
ncbi:FAD/NAD(P)-binding domain-containing protein [Tothia fuscella]|uniref:FAD/NAD(P)-binding domain-containing protein n=1 Tax=Tothia fuscella TaxID=1048955 RepID=A0A9P4TSG5_9PEZI|nr:FAD/NAD(P)-binding domain-containing protein [Tothia fuscella]